jgi:hypothetical protein
MARVADNQGAPPVMISSSGGELDGVLTAQRGVR